MHLVPGPAFGEQSGTATEIWFVPRDHPRGVEAHYALRMTGGPKAFLNLWLPPGRNPVTDWSWRVHASGVLLWRLHPEDEDAT